MLKGEMMIKTDLGEARLEQDQAAFTPPGEIREEVDLTSAILTFCATVASGKGLTI